MARFKRLTLDDLDNYTRDELLDRVEAEQQYWIRKARGRMTPADAEAEKLFHTILNAVCSPAELSQSMRDTTAWLKGERPAPTFWDEKPGAPK